MFEKCLFLINFLWITKITGILESEILEKKSWILLNFEKNLEKSLNIVQFLTFIENLNYYIIIFENLHNKLNCNENLNVVKYKVLEIIAFEYNQSCTNKSLINYYFQNLSTQCSM